MAALSLRLTDETDRRLLREAEVEGKTRSEIAREAILEYLGRREPERFMAEMTAELRQAYQDPDIRGEALEIAEDTTDDGLDAIITAERAAGIEPDEKWWL